MQVRGLGLSPEMYATSRHLKNWWPVPIRIPYPIQYGGGVDGRWLFDPRRKSERVRPTARSEEGTPNVTLGVIRSNANKWSWRRWENSKRKLPPAVLGTPGDTKSNPGHRVRRCTSRSRTRCMACTSSCSSVLICTKRMFSLVTASAIASASRSRSCWIFGTV